MDFFRFLITKKFLKHLTGAIILAALLLGVVLFLVRIYTRHGDYLSVPDFRGKSYDQLVSDQEYIDYRFFVIDSLFDLKKSRGTILHQDPAPDSRVKQGRMIYLTVVSSIPEKTSMPDLKFLTLRQAISLLESCGLLLGKLHYIQTFDEDAVQQQFYDGKVIDAGIKIDKGSVIDITVGMGSKSQEGIIYQKRDSTGTDSM